MTTFESVYLALEPFFPPLYPRVRTELKDFAKTRVRPEILDVGGRKSNYTIGVGGVVTITDLPRETMVQKTLNLGLTPGMRNEVLGRRSNIKAVLFDDMTRSSLPTCSVDCVVAVEVIEHVEEDDQFVKEVVRVLKPDGMVLITTPNGEFVPNKNPDHKRHYTRQSLLDLLSRHFPIVEVEYAMKAGPVFNLGLRPWSWRAPLRTATTMMSAYISSIQSCRSAVRFQANCTHQLIARGRKAASK
jgi:SAM-dependent methyltransferase